jgi:protein-S-isoprenylcysteine O-methyltransferase Ste14
MPTATTPDEPVFTPAWLWGAAFVAATVLAPGGLVLSAYMLTRSKPRDWLGWSTLLALSLAVTLVV